MSVCLNETAKEPGMFFSKAPPPPPPLPQLTEEPLVLMLSVVAAVAVLMLLSMLTSDKIKALRAKTNAEWIAAFKETAGTVADEEWAGELIDLFSPDYMSKE